MPLPNPRTQASFMDNLPVTLTEGSWSIRRRRETEWAASGQMLQTETAPDLWEFQGRIAIQPHVNAKPIRAALNSLMGVGQYFEAYDPLAQYPALDPDGSVIGSSLATVASIGSTNRYLIGLNSLPANYGLSVGDKMEIITPDGLIRQLVEIVEDANANSSGTTANFQVYPRIRLSIASGAYVKLWKPGITVSLIDSNAGRFDTATLDGITFTAVEAIL